MALNGANYCAFMCGISLGMVTGSNTNLDVQVFSGVICPWCYVGKRRLERALAATGYSDMCVRWLPFQLNPQMPKEGMNCRDYRAAKFGSLERSPMLDAQLTKVGWADGIPFVFEKIGLTPTTLDAHRRVSFMCVPAWEAGMLSGRATGEANQLLASTK
jgi:predicted DsbA family dithiol-disulfide isomerase